MSRRGSLSPTCPRHEKGRAPAVDPPFPACLCARLPPGGPAAPRNCHLPLLPSGSDGVHGVLPRRTRRSLPTHKQQSRREPDLERGFDPAIADCGYRAPLAPHLARPSKCYYGDRAKSSWRARGEPTPVQGKRGANPPTESASRQCTPRPEYFRTALRR